MSIEGKLDEASNSIIRFLRSNVPKSEIHKLDAELKKDFLLAKKKGKNLKRKTNKKCRTLTRKERRSLSFYNLPRNSLNYNDMLHLHYAWTEYITQILELEKIVPDCYSKNWDQICLKIYKADFHGCILHVIRSKCPSYVDKIGICIMDTKNTFKLLSKDNIITTIAKRDSVFEMHIKNKKIILYGKHLCIRPAERSVKKVKNQLHPDL